MLTDRLRHKSHVAQIVILNVEPTAVLQSLSASEYWIRSGDPAGKNACISWGCHSTPEHAWVKAWERLVSINPASANNLYRLVEVMEYVIEGQSIDDVLEEKHHDAKS